MDLEAWVLLHVRVFLVEDLRVVDDLDCALEGLGVFSGRVLEVLRQLLIECEKLGHFESQVVLASLDIVLELLSVNENVVLLGLPDEMHELVLGVVQGVLLLIALQVIVNQILIRVIDLLAVKIVHNLMLTADTLLTWIGNSLF